MSKEQVYTKNAPEPIGPYSQALKINAGNINLVYTSGQVGINPQTGNFTEGDIKVQTQQVLENLKAILTEAGTKLDNVVKTTVFLKDMNQFKEMNEVYTKFFGEFKPARSTLEAARLPMDALVEIEAIAII